VPFRDSSEGFLGTGKTTARAAAINRSAKAQMGSEDAESPEPDSRQILQGEDSNASNGMASHRGTQAARSKGNPSCRVGSNGAVPLASGRIVLVSLTKSTTRMLQTGEASVAVARSALVGCAFDKS